MTTPSFLALVVTGLLSALLSVPAAALGRRLGLVQRPLGVPLTGGLALVAAWWLVAPAALPELSRTATGLALATAIILIVGLADNRRKLGPGSQLLAQLAAALCATLVAGVMARTVTNPFGGLLSLTGWNTSGIPVLAAALSIAWIVFLMNAANFLDGVDGLAASVGTIGFLTIGAASLLPHVNEPSVALPAVAAAGATAGIVFHNFPPANIYLGTAGAWFIGFLLAVLSLQGSSKIATLAVVGAIPLLDALSVILGRLARGTSPFRGDTTHLHHRLAARGWSPRRIVVAYVALSAILAFAAVKLPTPLKILLVAVCGLAVVPALRTLYARQIDAPPKTT